MIGQSLMNPPVGAVAHVPAERFLLPCDNPSVEVVPGDPSVGSLHQRLIPHLGFAIGELFDFGPLARACRRLGRHEFLFTSVPLNVAGAIGSPANAVAIF
jgi:hypothetical protein